MFEAALNSAASAQGPAVSVTGASIRQGEYFAFESLEVYNAGSAPLSSFVVSTGGVPAAASYCYSLYDPAERSVVASTCPAMVPNPTSVTVSATLAAGKGVLVELTIAGRPFLMGSVSAVTVTASDGAQETLGVEVVPA